MNYPGVNENKEHLSQRDRQHHIAISSFVFSDFRYTKETSFLNRHIPHNSRNVRKRLYSILSEKIFAAVQRGERATTRLGHLFHGFNEPEELFHSRYEHIHLCQAVRGLWLRGTVLTLRLYIATLGLPHKNTRLILRTTGKTHTTTVVNKLHIREASRGSNSRGCWPINFEHIRSALTHHAQRSQTTYQRLRSREPYNMENWSGHTLRDTVAGIGYPQWPSYAEELTVTGLTTSQIVAWLDLTSSSVT